jgi:hypothetical protein
VALAETTGLAAKMSMDSTVRTSKLIRPNLLISYYILAIFVKYLQSKFQSLISPEFRYINDGAKDANTVLNGFVCMTKCMHYCMFLSFYKCLAAYIRCTYGQNNAVNISKQIILSIITHHGNPNCQFLNNVKQVTKTTV